ncbi:putative amine oxidase [copper-containing] [Babylonia areolata]|uniref:putative amine oxidase [copper-containing] n=1 Tax=Babylonia areolata TaxID=304850 RepID=UPI003FD5B3E7
MDSTVKFRRYIGCWRCAAALAIIAFCAVLIALIVVVIRTGDSSEGESLPCPTTKGGLMTSGDPQDPSPFHDLTVAEYKRLYRFLRQEKSVNLPASDTTFISTSSIFMMDLLLPPKQRVLSFLDNQGPQPAREARVMIFRGDKEPPVVEEYRVGPLSKPTYAELIVNSQRTNPVPFSFRPVGGLEFLAIFYLLMPVVDQKVGHILMESYGGKFTHCGDNCLTFYPAPVGTQLIQQTTRLIWLLANYKTEYYTLHPLDFGFLMNVDGSDATQWSVEQVWYSGTMYSSLDDLADKYANDPSTNKTRVDYVHNSPDLTSTQRLRGTPAPDPPQRPPLQMEPDGKRYSIHHRHVRYLHWDFDIRLSAFTGPQVYDIRFQGDRIAYELGLSEIAVFYAGFNPMQRVTDLVDSGSLIGTHSKSLIPGVDCPEGATFLNVSFFGEGMAEPTTLARAQCVFEQNTGVPLRRHMSYSRDQGAFFGGMSDSVLVVRSILTISNYDYIVDFVFHQSGAIECRAISTGYITSTFYHPQEDPYGFRLNDRIIGNLHHHLFHFKADLDIGGTSNRYETLDISEEQVRLRQWQPPSTMYNQIRYQRHLYNTENEAVYKYNFDNPRYHIVHNEQKKTQYGVPRAFRLHMAGMSKQLLTLGENNEKTIPWARQQLAVTVQKDDELVSSSPYALFDSYQPVTDFSNFISDEGIVDKDLVFWVTLGTHHIPHTEDIPVTPTVGGHLSFFLLPYNYFPECPSVSSRDNIRVEYVTANQPAEGLKVDRSGNQESRVCGAVSLEQLVRQRPDDFLQTNREFKLI